MTCYPSFSFPFAVSLQLYYYDFQTIKKLQNNHKHQEHNLAV